MHPRDAMVAGLLLCRDCRGAGHETRHGKEFHLPPGNLYQSHVEIIPAADKLLNATICTRLTLSLKTCPKLPFSKNRAAILFTYSTTISGSLQVTYMPLLVRPRACAVASRYAVVVYYESLPDG